MTEETTDTQATAEAEVAAAPAETPAVGAEETSAQGVEAAGADAERAAAEAEPVAEAEETVEAAAEVEESEEADEAEEVPVAEAQTGEAGGVDEAEEAPVAEAEVEEAEAADEAEEAPVAEAEVEEAEAADEAEEAPVAEAEVEEAEAADEAEEAPVAEAEVEEAEAADEAEEAPVAEAEVEEAEAADEAEEESEVAAGAVVAPQSINDLEKKMKVKGTVERLELYGAFIDIGLETPALIHISKIGKNRVNRVSDAFSVGDEVEVWVEKVDADQNQIMVSMMEPLAVEWSDLKERQVYTGTVTRLENFGAFVDIGAEREGLVHISEMSHDYVKHPSDVVSVDGDVQVQVLGFNRRKRRIDLSMKALLDTPRDEQVATAEDFEALEDSNEELPTAMEIAMRRAMQKDEREDEKKRRKQRKQKGQNDILSRTLKMRE